MRALGTKTMMRRSPLRSIQAAAVATALAVSTLTGSAAFGMGAAALARPAGVLMATDADGRAVQIGKAVTSDGRPRLGVQVTSNLVAAHSGRCLDVTGGNGATGNGVPVQQYDCLGSGQTNQVWSFENETVVGGDYYYNIVAAHSGKCLDVTGGNSATGNGVPVQQYDCLGLGQSNQMWYRFGP